jgi:5,5'-dehydrodivanillate O-demethylase
VGQGAVADRTQEHLGESDRGVIAMRKRMQDDARAVAEGREPRGLVRDAALNECINLPIVGRQRFLDGFPISELQKGLLEGRQGGTPGTPLRPLGEFVFQSGQPADIKEAFIRAMGLDRVLQPSAG